jgi:hypothetical protein
MDAAAKSAAKYPREANFFDLCPLQFGDEGTSSGSASTGARRLGPFQVSPLCTTHRRHNTAHLPRISASPIHFHLCPLPRFLPQSTPW